MRFLPVSLTVMIVELQNLDETLALFASLEAEPVDGVVDIVPAARTLMIRFRPETLSAEMLAAEISTRDLSAKIAASEMLVEIPVTYNGEDLQDVAGLTGLSIAEVIERHTASEFTVAFCGFAPGFGYLVGGDPALQVPRAVRARARRSPPARWHWPVPSPASIRRQAPAVGRSSARHRSRCGI